MSAGAVTSVVTSAVTSAVVGPNDLSNYESDENLLVWAGRGDPDRIESILESAPYSLNHTVSVRVSAALIKKYGPGMYFIVLLIAFINI